MKPTDRLMELRSQVDGLDLRLLDLLNKRAQLVVEIGALKYQNNIPMRDRSREREIVKRLVGENTGPLDEEAILKLYRVIFYQFRRLQHKDLLD